MSDTDNSLFDAEGRRKYLTKTELASFLKAAESLSPKERSFCQALMNTGGRLSEVLALRKQEVDSVQKTITIRSLKKRDKKHFRSIPISAEMLSTLDNIFDVRRGKAADRLWDVTERTANRWVMKAMVAAGLDHHSPRSLRHSFGVSAVMHGVPLTTIKKWLGHADIKTTAIYTNAMGDEERGLAERMWA